MALPSTPALRPSPYPQSSLPVNHFSTVPRELLHVLSRFVPYEATLVARANRWLYSCYKAYPFVWLGWIRVIQSTPHGNKFFEDHKSDIVASKQRERERVVVSKHNHTSWKKFKLFSFQPRRACNRHLTLGNVLLGPVLNH